MKNTIKQLLSDLLDFDLPAIEQPKDKNLAHFAIPMFLLAKQQKKSPNQIASEVANKLGQNSVFSATASGGYVNLKLCAEFLSASSKEALLDKENFAKVSRKNPQKFYIEYISANPTGPLHIGHVRGAVYGDTLVRVAKHLGHIVHSEYYINDAGNQIDLLGLSLSLRAKELLFNQNVIYPQKYYRGEYIDVLAVEISKNYPVEIFDDIKSLANIAKDKILELIKNDLADCNIFIQHWISEVALYSNIENIITKLEHSNQMYEKNGSKFIASTKCGDDEDRVVIRDDGRPTYLAGDIAYHEFKFAQNFDHYINIWGADHHGYIARLKAAIHFLDYDENKLEVILMQMVNLLKDNKPFKISKRNGTAILMSDIAKEIGADALRYIFISKAANTPLEFDIDELKKFDSSNVIFYINYAHARINQVMQKVEGKFNIDANFDDLNNDGLNLAFLALSLEDVLENALQTRSLHKISDYLKTLASDFHKFYNENKVLGSKNQDALLKLFSLCALSIKTGLSLLGIKALDKMEN